MGEDVIKHKFLTPVNLRKAAPLLAHRTYPDQVPFPGRKDPVIKKAILWLAEDGLCRRRIHTADSRLNGAAKVEHMAYYLAELGFSKKDKELGRLIEWCNKLLSLPEDRKSWSGEIGEGVEKNPQFIPLMHLICLGISCYHNEVSNPDFISRWDSIISIAIDEGESAEFRRMSTIYDEIFSQRYYFGYINKLTYLAFPSIYHLRYLVARSRQESSGEKLFHKALVWLLRTNSKIKYTTGGLSNLRLNDLMHYLILFSNAKSLPKHTIFEDWVVMLKQILERDPSHQALSVIKRCPFCLTKDWRSPKIKYAELYYRWKCFNSTLLAC